MTRALTPDDRGRREHSVGRLARRSARSSHRRAKLSKSPLRLVIGSGRMSRARVGSGPLPGCWRSGKLVPGGSARSPLETADPCSRYFRRSIRMRARHSRARRVTCNFFSPICRCVFDESGCSGRYAWPRRARRLVEGSDSAQAKVGRQPANDPDRGPLPGRISPRAEAPQGPKNEDLGCLRIPEGAARSPPAPAKCSPLLRLLALKPFARLFFGR